MDKYQPLRDAGTSAGNYDLDTDDIIRRLQAWDDRYGIALSEVGHDRVDVAFDRTPDDLSEFAREVYLFCPDTVDQGFGCVAEMLEVAEGAGQSIPPEIAELAEGADLEEADYGVELLARSIARTQSLSLWWD